MILTVGCLHPSRDHKTDRSPPGIRQDEVLYKIAERVKSEYQHSAAQTIHR